MFRPSSSSSFFLFLFFFFFFFFFLFVFFFFFLFVFFFFFFFSFFLSAQCLACINQCVPQLGVRRLDFLPRLVPACLELALSGVDAITAQSRDWYFELLLLEFSTTGAIQRMENQTIDAVDTIISRLSVCVRAGGVLHTFLYWLLSC